jgi:tight adherence protein C
MFLFTVVLVPLANVLWGIGYSPLVMLWGALLGAFYGFKLPDFWLSMTIKRRQNAIQIFMPDMIDLITVSVEAGLGLDAAIQRVSQRFANPLSEEFMRAMQEVRLGRTRVEALRDMARRTDVADLTSFITSLVQAELLGIAIANVLRIQSERLREKRSQRAREQAQKAPIKMVFPLVLFIFPALFVVILGPALIQVLTSGFGG